jgi:hypothetical protein
MDGVINSEATFSHAKENELFKEKCLEDRPEPFLIDPLLRDKINEILKTVEKCMVVWTSTWRMGLRDSKILIEGFYNQCGFEKNSFLSYTPITSSKFRYMEILDWLKIFDGRYNIEKCAIIDDDDDAGIPKNLEKEFGKNSPYIEIAKKYNTKFFQTSFKTGITDEIKNKILVYFQEV